ncbi:MAG: radical SAM protein [Nitrospirae bacterium]|nr:radical SAM protein [Nitrospirota bacterium]
MGLLYTKMKVFHFREKLESLSAKNPDILPPIQIRIKPTNVCAHNCWYCAYKADNLKLGKDMVKSDHIPKDKMIEIINDCTEMGVRSITFSGGGDPFHYPYLVEAVKKLAHSPVKFASLTHGARLEGELAEIFSEYATWLRVSIDGWDDASYSEYRSVPQGEYTRVMKNLEAFKKISGKCYLGVVLITDKKNAPHVYSQIEKLKNIGVNSIKISPCIVSEVSAENNSYHKELFPLVKDQIQKAMNSFADSNFEIYDAYHTLEERFEKSYTWCPYIQIVPVIGADMNVYTCHDKAYDLDEGLLGSIKDQSFKNFWFSNKEKFFKINPSKDCNHHCMVNFNNNLIHEYLNADEDHLDFV